MAIEKLALRCRFDQDYHSPHSREIMSSDDDEMQQRNSVAAVEFDDEDDDEFDDCDSGAGSDDFDLLELGEAGEEFCQVGNQTCSFPYELYDLPGLKDVLCMDVWNEVLTEEDRFGLARYLPDMDQENFVRTLKELFSGDNLHFGSPIDKLFEMLRGGECEPRVALYQQGANFLQMRRHYHNLRENQNAMVNNLCQIRDAWKDCRGYSIEEKLRVLNIMKSQKSLMNENLEEFGSEPSDRDESGDGLWVKRGKDLKHGQKVSQYAGYEMVPGSDFSSHGLQMSMESGKHRKRNYKGSQKSGSYGLSLPLSRHNRMEMYDSWRAFQTGGENDDEQESIYDLAVHRDHRLALRSTGFPGSSKNDAHAFSRDKNINQLSDIQVLIAKPSNARMTSDYGNHLKYMDNVQQFPVENKMKFGKAQKSNSSLKRSQQMELVRGSEPSWPSKQNDGLFAVDPSNRRDFSAKNIKWKMDSESPDVNSSNKSLHAGYIAKPSQEDFRPTLKNGGPSVARKRGIRDVAGEETESDSAERDGDDDDDNPLMRSKWAFPGGVPDLKYESEAKKVKLSKKDKKNSYLDLDGPSRSSRSVAVYEDLQNIGAEQNGSLISRDGREQFYNMEQNSHIEGDYGGRFHVPLRKPFSAERTMKDEAGRRFGVPKSNLVQDYDVEDDLVWTRPLAADNGFPFRFGKKGQIVETFIADRSKEPYVALTGSISVTKKRKTKYDSTYFDSIDNNDYVHSSTQLQLDDTSSSKRHGKSKVDEASDASDKGYSETPLTEVEDVEVETKKLRKPLTPITPTVHNDFSFSIIHLLAAVRMAMITWLPEDSSGAGKSIDKNDAGEMVEEDQEEKQEDTSGVNSDTKVDVENSVPSMHGIVPSLTIQEIVSRVKSNPGDPSILETQEPLQDLVRGVLKIFSSRTAPLGAKGWKPLVIYEKSTKSWSWIGPVSSNSSDNEADDDMISPGVWSLPHKMLVKLVDSFANWLKNSQDTLQQIGSLPAPPSTLMQFKSDEKERFKDLRAQKSLSTISPSCEEVRAYFRKEELLRYLIPDRAFTYTAIDGKKSIVAPLRRCGGKPTSKARDHFMLKRDRPPHVTILCLVRDAAARLPGSIGTRADVCTLIRDSQYIVEDVSDAQVNQVVSGALDRLHYERDPCVQFDGERKLWVYLHREREEEDFEDDGTSSTKKWRRQKKDTTEPADQGDVTAAYPGPVEETGVELLSDLNIEVPFSVKDNRSEVLYQNGNGVAEDNVEISHSAQHDDMIHGPANIIWDGLETNAVQDSKLLCHENSTNEDFDDMTDLVDSLQRDS